VPDYGLDDLPKHGWNKSDHVKVRVLCFVWSGLLLTGFTQQDDDDDDAQIHNVIGLNGYHRVMFKAGTRKKEGRGEM
jgi:hypothetical protein